MPEQTILLKPNQIYHIFNHGNADEGVFRTDENFRFFLKKYDQYLSPVTFTYAYCLMPNHFHFLIKIKDTSSIKDHFHFIYPEAETLQENDIPGFVNQKLKNFLNSYSRSFNRFYKRKGKLFLQSTQKRFIVNETYFLNALHYIHQNPVHHGFVKDPAEWKFSSFHSYITNKETKVKKDWLSTYYENIEAFKASNKNGDGIEEYALEMDLLY